ncbi:MAG TPA: DNA-binding protein [Lentisphaeria bacterium]|nr:MAG: DNA-binding protein [Lentisphaerae bacterium GWF2_50_93]HCE45595.1 DNA-binding protein [Lentisphaeria bacterium]
MKKQKEPSVVPVEQIQQSILFIRGQKVLLDRDLAVLYGVETKVLKQAVKRNIGRFPSDFMFMLAGEELAILRSQFVTSRSWGGSRHPSMVFTEQGVAMLSSVLNSERAIHVNIEIMRTFVQLRHLLMSHEGLSDKLNELEKKYDAQFRIVFDAIRQIMTPAVPPKRKIGFHINEKQAQYRVKKKTGRIKT